MSPNCIEVERIADVESLPEGHPTRHHVATCPRCQSLWLSYQSFMKADVSDAAHIDRARVALEQSIRRQAGVGPEPAQRAARMERRSGRSAWFGPALVTAMAAVLAVVAITVWRGGPSSDEPVLRGDADKIWTLQAPQLSDEQIVFGWEAVPDADAYEVQLFDDALNEVYNSGPVTTTSTRVHRDSLPSVAAGASLTWRVRALRGGDVVSTSPPASLTLP